MNSENCKETDIPVVSTMMGIGILPSDNPRYYGMIGSHGVKRANLLSIVQTL